MSSISPPQPTEDYKRLQLIEQKVISCVQIAAQVTEHFSRVGRTAELAGPVQQLCTTFMNTIAEALQLVKEGAESSSGDHRLELHAYHSLARAHINTEKLQVMRMHLDAMQAELEAAAAGRECGRAGGGCCSACDVGSGSLGAGVEAGNGGMAVVMVVMVVAVAVMLVPLGMKPCISRFTALVIRFTGGTSSSRVRQFGTPTHPCLRMRVRMCSRSCTASIFPRPDCMNLDYPCAPGLALFALFAWGVSGRRCRSVLPVFDTCQRPPSSYLTWLLPRW
ncbi:hypothetical protein VOLCADRAFT_88545 [Volvox carteri f. nagariensis]|uniref:Mediator of RNA polymerase II transcription subunit 11 n=1 Tax=Volvox carteri f. nagariensis TaxID=3068 RepID=D8TPA4_VOLCA|nr:uncharacterized protein VOLCADRAFT_88545 [Volvox carteri f. nagariensis]EFJ50588.1 hypothetical protein VOLCADRAFT_88545 [Volvox carteri f. nagariensis]|eukprot:XP_002948181.1 hypothetical protein VOLCADRAFT_88545 [Volvox carteri f. nagariensis]